MNMKKFLFYSPYIPLVGLLTTILSMVLGYQMVNNNDKSIHYYASIVVQSLGSGILLGWMLF